MEVTRVEVAGEAAQPGIDEHQALGGLDQQGREPSVQLAVCIEVRAHERSLELVVVIPEHEPR